MFPLALGAWLTLTSDLPNPLPAILPGTLESELEASSVASERPWSDRWTETRPLHNATSVPDSIASLPLDGDKRKAANQIGIERVALSMQTSVRDPEWVREDPLRRGYSWTTNESVRLTFSDQFFLFGNFDAESQSVEEQRLSWSGKTGVGLKLRPWLLNEVQLRGGPVVRYDGEQGSLATTIAERSEMFVEVQTKVPLPVVGPVNVEYSGTAIAAVTSNEREQIRQNLKFALPLSRLSQFHVGANWRSADSFGPTPFIDRTQLYLGVQLKR